MNKNPSRNVHLRKGPSKLLETINVSINVDQRLYNEDIEASIAHTKMLAKQNIITNKDKTLIISGLNRILKEIKKGKINFKKELEDIHMNIENLLQKKIGPTAGKLHTARSRNDQVITDLKLWIKKNSIDLDSESKNFQKSLISIAKKNTHTIMPGYTHLQIAQPISLAFHLIAYVEMIGRDRSRLADCINRLNQNPLGSGAIAGTSFNIDRKMTTKLLNFKEPTINSLDTVSDRDFVVEFIFVLSLFAVHLSRIAEEIILWSSQQYNFISLSDDIATGSSIMPQKKNPDGAELVRSKAAIVISNLNNLLIILKGLPLGYNKDLQEDKKLIFDSFDTVKLCIQVIKEIIEKVKFNKKEMKKAVDDSNSTATDLANWLVINLNYTFREAYKLTGKIVAFCNKKNINLDQLSLKDLKKFDKKISKFAINVLSSTNSIKNKKSFGGTSPQSVNKSIQYVIKKYL
tara:strand:- start:1773 stop:3155 length:1383 start_codon:yes stop_codon:yes gene_type:complete